MSTVTYPIRELLKSDISFIWSKPQEEAFNKIKAILSAEPVLASGIATIEATEAAASAKIEIN